MDKIKQTSLMLHSFVDQLRPYLVDQDALGRIYADLHDLFQAGSWLLRTIEENEGKALSSSELEDLLVDIDVHFVKHSLFHLNSLSTGIKATLNNFPAADDR